MEKKFTFQKKFRLPFLVFLCLVFTWNTAFAQYPSITTVPPYGVNGTGGVTFNIKAYGHKVVIKRFWTELASTSCSFNIYYKTDSISSAPNTGTQPWILATTATFTTTNTVGTTTIDTIPVILNIPIPAGRTYGFWISTVSGGLYYRAPGVGDTSCRFDGNIHVNMGVGVGYGGAAPVVVATPRQLCGRVEYDVIPNPPNEAALSEITSPPGTFCAGNYPVKAIIVNNGSNRIDSVRVRWTLDGVPQVGLNVSIPLDTPGHVNGNSREVTLATSVSFGSGVTRTIKAWTAYPNGVPDTVNVDDTVLVSKHNSLNGIYTIGGSPGPNNYTSFNAAAADLKNYGVCGPVTFNVAPGTYTEQVEIEGPIGGSSATNWITFEGTNPATRIITHNSTGITSAFHTVQLLGVSHLTFRNFTVNALGTDNAFGILVRGGGVNNVYIKKCTVNLVNAGTASTVNFAGIVITGVVNSPQQGSQRADSLQIDSNTTNFGYYGIIHFGAGGAQDWSCKYRNNTVNNAYYYGMYLQYHDGCKINNNRITMRPDNTTGYSMYLFNLSGTAAVGNVEIIGNKMIGINNGGIYLSTAVNLATNKGVIANNMIGGSIKSATNYGIYMTGANYWSVAHNSVNFDLNLTSATYSPLNIASGLGNSIMNNIFSVKKTGSLALPLYIGSTSYIDSMDYNIFYRADTANTQLIYLAGYYSPSNFKGAGGFNANSIYADPGFVNDTNLHLTNACFRGITLPYITTDIDGITRATPPVMGAHEYLNVTNDLAVVNIVSPVAPFSAGAQDLTVKIKNAGSNLVTSFNLTYRLNGGTVVTQTWFGNLYTCDTVSVTFTGTQQVTLVSANTLKIYTSSPNFSTDNNHLNDTLNVILLTPLSGNYTINPAGSGASNFTSFAAATTALTTYGVAGPVTFNVAAGTYNEAVNISGTILGLSALNPIIFDGGNGNASTRIITANVAAGATVTINQKNYIQFKNLTITNTNNGNSAAVTIIGNATALNNGTGCAIKKCILNIPNLYNVTNTSACLSITSATTPYSFTAVWADSIEIDSNIINGGQYALGFYGASNANYNRGIKFRNNTIYSWYYGIYSYYIYNPIDIMYNTINMYTINATYGYYGMYIYTNNNTSTTTSSRIIGNKVFGASNYGIYLTTPGGTSTAPVQIYNNMVSSASFSAYNCLYLNSSGYTEIYHNTLIYNFNTTTTTYGALYAAGSTNLWVKNNIFGHEAVGTGAGTSPAYFATNPSGNQVNYNIYYNKTGTTLLYRAGIYTAANFLSATAGGDTSYNLIPTYTNPALNDFHFTNVCTQRGLDLTTRVPDDIDGQTRGVPPQIGCDEYPGTTLDLMIDALLQPSFPVLTGSQDVRVLVRNNGSITITQFNIAYRLNNGTPVTQTIYYSLGPCDTTSVVFTGTQQISIVANTNYSLKVYTYSPNSTIDGNRSNDTILTNVATPMTGTYTIGATASDFTSFNAAVAAMQLRGVSGNVIFNVRTGIYNERLTLPAITGASAGSIITFKSLANNADSVIMNAAVSDPNILSLAGAQYVKFFKLTFQSSSITTTVNGITISGNSAYDSIVSCKILMAIQGSYTNYTIYATGLNSNNMGLVFKNNLIQGSYYGIYWYGTSSTNRPNNTVFDGNTIQNGYYSQFYYMYYTLNTKFVNNIINENGNYAYNYSYFYYDDSLLFANNVISTGVTVVYPYWYLGYSSNQVKVFNNSFNHASISANGYLPYLYNNAGYSGYEVKNNIFSCTGAGFAAYWAVLPTAAVSDNNLYYSATGTLLISGASSPANLAAWRSTCNCDKHSISYRTAYTSNTNLIPNSADSAVWAMNGRGAFLQQVNTDINGNARPMVNSEGVPDLGAYELTPNSMPPVAIASGPPTAGQTQSFTFGGDSVARITWDAFITPPPFVHIRQYGGKKPLNIGNPLITPNSNNFMYFYDSIYAPSGSYNYFLRLHYHQEWLGNITNEGQLGIVQKTAPTGVPWALVSTTGVDSTLNFLTGDNMYSFGWMTGTDIYNPLPVKLLNLSAHAKPNSINVSWITASEVNSNYFIVERSTDPTGAKRFVKAGTVKAAGNSNNLTNYLFEDFEGRALLANGTVYYRLAIYDKDGSMQYSNIVAVNENITDDIIVEVFPNPFNDQVVVNVGNAKGGNINITVFDINGRPLYNSNFENSSNILNLDGIPSGVYFVNIRDNEFSKVVKLIKK